MTISEARQILLTDTLDPDGIFTQLRLGEVPSEEGINRLRIALRILWRELAAMDSVPRDIAFTCGLILHFKEECINNLRSSGNASGASLNSVERAVNELTQGAFDVLAGKDAEVVVRLDLGDAG